MSPRKLEWDSILPAAQDAFNIWTDHPELAWARQAWQKLGEAGLTTYDTELERCEVGIRLLVLASLYRDWCAVAKDELQDDEPASWAALLDIEPFSVGCLVGLEGNVDADDDPEDAVTTALTSLMERERKAVVDALFLGFGDETELFIALWRSSLNPDHYDSPEDGEDGNFLPTDADILNDVTEEKLAGFLWLREGCPSLCTGTVRAFYDHDGF